MFVTDAISSNQATIVFFSAIQKGSDENHVNKSDAP